MLRPPAVRAAAFALLLAGAASPLAFGESNPPSRASSPQPDIFSEVWSSLRSFVTYLGHVIEVDPNGLQLSGPDAGHDIDPNG
jgi:hypothetical protein